MNIELPRVFYQFSSSVANLSTTKYTLFTLPPIERPVSFRLRHVNSSFKVNAFFGSSVGVMEGLTGVLVIEDEVLVIGKFLKLHRNDMAPAGKASLTLRTLTPTAM